MTIRSEKTLRGLLLWNVRKKSIGAQTAAGPPWRKASGRDHCPNCLCGIHREDVGYGECGGTLEPVSVWIKEDDCWEIIQRCRLCGKMTASAVADDDNRIKLLSVASKPLSFPPFPIEKLEELTRIMGGSGELEKSTTGGHQNEQRK